jgi:molecular chaperone HtpG
MVAAALRLADILDFDRERTPAALFHYLVTAPLDPEDDRSVLEWGKHMSISNWEITDSSVLYRARCTHHVIHHAILEFTRTIAHEFSSTRETFVARNSSWPFVLSGNVTADIQAEGYRYLPYRFELDDSRVYELLMGGAIYDRPVVAVRELLQNAIDACRLRDSLATARAPYLAFSTAGRIRVRYEEPNATGAYPRLTIEDTGVGMDSLIIENYFLRVGRSYYNSAEFQEERLMLREKNLDFAPVSEFGIGFLSVFLLGDNVVVDTAASEPRRGDYKRHSLHIHGPSRLIRVNESPNEGPARFSGTSVSIDLTRGGDAGQPLSWKEVEHYVADLCQDLPYSLTLQHLDSTGMHESELERCGTSVHLPRELSLRDQNSG